MPGSLSFQSLIPYRYRPLLLASAGFFRTCKEEKALPARTFHCRSLAPHTFFFLQRGDVLFHPFVFFLLFPNIRSPFPSAAKKGMPQAMFLLWHTLLTMVLLYLSLSCAPNSFARPSKIACMASAMSVSAKVRSALRKEMEYATDL